MGEAKGAGVAQSVYLVRKVVAGWCKMVTGWGCGSSPQATQNDKGPALTAVMPYPAQAKYRIFCGRQQRVLTLGLYSLGAGEYSKHLV